MPAALSWSAALAHYREPRPSLERVEISAKAKGLPAALSRLASARARYLKGIEKSDPKRGRHRAKRADKLLWAGRYVVALPIVYLAFWQAGVPSGPVAMALMLMASAAFWVGGPVRMLLWTKLWFGLFGLLTSLFVVPMLPANAEWWAVQAEYWRGGGSWTLANSLILFSSAVIWLWPGALLCRSAGRFGRWGVAQLEFLDGLRRHDVTSRRARAIEPQVEARRQQPSEAISSATPAGIAALIGGVEAPEDAARIAAQAARAYEQHFVTNDGEVLSAGPVVHSPPATTETAAPAIEAVAPPEPAPATEPAPAPKPVEAAGERFDPDRPAALSLSKADLPADAAALSVEVTARLGRALAAFRDARENRSERQLVTMLRANWRTWGAAEIGWLAAQPDGPELLTLREINDVRAGGTRFNVPDAHKPFGLAGRKGRPLDAFKAAPPIDQDPEPVADQAGLDTLEPDAAAQLTGALEKIRQNAQAAKNRGAAVPASAPSTAETTPADDVAVDAATDPWATDQTIIVEEAGTEMATGNMGLPRAQEHRPFAARQAAPAMTLEGEVVRRPNHGSEPDLAETVVDVAGPIDPAQSIKDLRVIAGLFQSGITYRQVRVITGALQSAGIDKARLDAAMEQMVGLRDDLHADCMKYLRLREMDGEVTETETGLGELEAALDQLTRRPDSYYRERGKILERIDKLETRVSTAVAAGADNALVGRLRTATQSFATISHHIETRNFRGLAAMSAPVVDDGPVADMPSVMSSISNFGRNNSKAKRPKASAPPPPAPKPPLLNAMERQAGHPVAPETTTPPPVESAPVARPVASPAVVAEAAPVPAAPAVANGPAKPATPPQESDDHSGDDGAPRSDEKKERPDTSAEQAADAASSAAGTAKVPRDALGQFYPAEVRGHMDRILVLIKDAMSADVDRTASLGAGETAKAEEAERRSQEKRLEAGELAAEGRALLASRFNLPADADDSAYEPFIDPRAYYAFVDYFSKPIGRAEQIRNAAPAAEPEASDGKLVLKSAGPQRFSAGQLPEALQRKREQIEPHRPSAAVPTENILMETKKIHEVKTGAHTVGSLQLISVHDGTGRIYINLTGYAYDQRTQSLRNETSLSVHVGAFKAALRDEDLDPVLLFSTEADRATVPPGLGEIKKTDSFEAICKRGKPL